LPTIESGEQNIWQPTSTWARSFDRISSVALAPSASSYFTLNTEIVTRNLYYWTIGEMLIVENYQFSISE
jgi:hypothetical protein